MRRIRAVIFDAVTHFNNDDGWAMASHVALSILMALFPFMIFGTSLASFLGAHAYADTASHLIFDTWPDSIAAPISREVVNVLTIERGGLLTLSVLAAAFFSANGVEALRVSLNRAYRVTETRAWYVTRAQSLGFVVIAVMVIMAISFLLVLAPLVLRLARQFAPWMETLISAVDNWRILIAVTVLIVGLVMSHMWLPDGRRRLKDVLPGIGVTLVAWVAGALMFASYLQEFATYVSTYAGLASIMVALVFLYIIAAIFILGAEINAAILKARARAEMRKKALQKA
ncbi:MULTISPECIES: YihY/virulence factor BrkB family protein [Hoeflea]|uniref:Ribonuclease BN n=1 Tax=Hoeflea alexandrii TaxID=288436 RepID=A0ABT1CQJ2_9HYPH|nr:MULTISPECIES: YihY/virulence factor BrkB family protein [Hoeflea]MBV6648569.1 YihY/virulence factor BrkB family protein [Hoeflea sp.]MCO6408465.1 ribonuclease BN [Hoeflea alexandrii]MCY0151179.1 YihY/virulence factor BrkB family protein [Hoeflea alexandrii]VVT35026.1 Ribonuclease BN [Hoeflea sp. EC-HK425]